MPMRVNLTLKGRLETHLYEALPTELGYIKLDFLLVRLRGLLCQTLFVFVCVAANSICPGCKLTIIPNS